mmetsp:Transcript_84010/g.237874  ORF Transcript_84010/g.237874 Transcript_84010/m.237874 type:complete len:407 (+) Transcript_84010:3993-5213(+)
MPKLAAHLLARALGSVETDDLPHPYGVWGLATPDRPASMVFEDDDDGGGSGDVGDDDDWWSVGFEGVYSDPLHKKCDRTIVKISDTKAEVSGYDAYYNFFFRFDPLHCDGDHDVAWGPFDGALDLSGLTDEIGDTTKHTGKDTITVDFSAKGGPSNLVGEWDPEVPGIKWADGNTWTWLRALESEGGVEGEEEGEAQGGSDAGGGRTRRRLRSTSERRRLEASSNSTNDGTDTSAAEEATPAASPTATPTSPLEDEVMASLKSIPGNYSDPDHPGCGEFGSTRPANRQPPPGARRPAPIDTILRTTSHHATLHFNNAANMRHAHASPTHSRFLHERRRTRTQHYRHRHVTGCWYRYWSRVRVRTCVRRRNRRGLVNPSAVGVRHHRKVFCRRLLGPQRTKRRDRRL